MSCQREERSCWGWLVFIQLTRAFPIWCQHIHVAPVRKAETKLLRTVTIDKGIAYLIDVSISTLCQWEKLKWCYWGRLAFIQWMDKGIAYLICQHIHVTPVRKAEMKLLRMVRIWRIQSQLTRALPTWLMSAYPHCASEKSQNEAIEDGEHSSRNWWTRVLPTWCRHIHVVLVRKGSLMKLFLEGIPSNWQGALPTWCQHIHIVPAHLMLAYPCCASERNRAAVRDG